MWGANREVLRRYLRHKEAEGVSRGRLRKIAYVLDKLSRLAGRPLDSIGREELVEALAKLEGMGYSAWTKHTMRAILRGFLRWIGRGDLAGLVSMRGRPGCVVNPADLLSRDDLKRMLDASPSFFWRAYIRFSYESGARIGEILNMRVGDLFKGERFWRARLFGKTGQRVIAIVESIPALSAYLRFEHPSPDDPGSWLWQAGGERVGGDYIRRGLRRIARAAGLRKRVYPHLFRHSRATELASRMPELALKRYMGWAMDSKMAAVYVSLSDPQLEESYLRIYGLAREEGRCEVTCILKCPRCGLENEGGSAFCAGCGLLLDVSNVEEAEELEIAERIGEMLLRKPEVRRAIRKALEEMIKDDFKAGLRSQGNMRGSRVLLRGLDVKFPCDR